MVVANDTSRLYLLSKFELCRNSDGNQMSEGAVPFAKHIRFLQILAWLCESCALKLSESCWERLAPCKSKDHTQLLGTLHVAALPKVSDIRQMIVKINTKLLLPQRLSKRLPQSEKWMSRVLQMRLIISPMPSSGKAVTHPLPRQQREPTGAGSVPAAIWNIAMQLQTSPLLQSRQKSQQRSTLTNQTD